MNNFEELVSHGIDKHTANRMLESYQSHIGTINGDYRIIDITYDFDKHGRDVTLECTECGDIIHRSMIKGRNKWSELIHTCPKCKEEKIRQKKISEKEKKEQERIAKADARREAKINKPIKIRQYKYNESFIGQKHNHLTVIGLEKSPDGHTCFLCQCDCGKTCLVKPCWWADGTIKSCGCRQKEHGDGHSKERLYTVWQSMKNRCFYSKDGSYPNYGGRGITICPEWMEYKNFREWAYANGYDDQAERGECTIDRINVNGNYEPNNCRWISNQEQQKNKRPSNEWKPRERRSFVEFKGQSISKHDLCEQYGISVETFNYRVNTKGMTIEEALTTPKMTDGRPKKQSVA